MIEIDKPFNDLKTTPLPVSIQMDWVEFVWESM
jgi:hypothetical protein